MPCAVSATSRQRFRATGADRSARVQALSIKRDARPRRTVDSSIDAAISRKVRRAKPGTVFTPALFAGLGGRAAVDKALRSLGPEHVTPQRLDKLTRSIPAAERRTLLDGLSLAPGWMQPTLRTLAADR